MTVNGTAAGVPYTALPPAHGGPAPLVLTWHMLDAPRTNAAFAAALPMAGVPAWRVHLGLPMCGDRMVNGSMDAIIDLARTDTLHAFGDGLSQQAVEEFPEALKALRMELPIKDGPIGIVGGSLGGLVALRVLTESKVPIAAAALINPLIRVRTLVDLIDEAMSRTYPWDTDKEARAKDLDFVQRAAEIKVPLLVVSGENDHTTFQTDAAALTKAAPLAELHTVPDLAHPLAEEPGMEPAPQLPKTKLVDDALTTWFTRHMP